MRNARVKMLRARHNPPPLPVRHGQGGPQVVSLRLLRGPGGCQHHPRHIDQLTPELVRGDLITHVVVSPLSVQPEVMLALKLFSLSEEISRLLAMLQNL